MVSQASTDQPASVSISAYSAAGVRPPCPPGTACPATRPNPFRAARHLAHRGMRRRVEVAGHLARRSTRRRPVPGPAHQQLAVLGHPLQRRVAQHDVGVRLRRPLLDAPRRRRPDRARAPRRPSPASCPRPRSTASGHRCEGSRVRLPGPQPRSTTRRGDSAPTRDSRSKNGRPRWSAKARYTSGFHMTQIVLLACGPVILV